MIFNREECNNKCWKIGSKFFDLGLARSREGECGDVEDLFFFPPPLRLPTSREIRLKLTRDPRIPCDIDWSATYCDRGPRRRSVPDKSWAYWSVDALHLSIPAQGLPNGEAALQHAAAYPGMQPYPGVGKFFLPHLLFPSSPSIENSVKPSVSATSFSSNFQPNAFQ